VSRRAQKGRPDPAKTRPVDGPTDAEFRRFVGRNAEYYARARAGELAWRLNWGGLFFGWLWMLYRKMYVPAVVALCVGAAPFVVTEFGAAQGNGEPTRRANERTVMLALNAVIALVGNRLYLRHVATRCAEVSRGSANEAERLVALERAGGTSALAPLIGVAAVVAFALASALA
jgi:hypothetical protein